MILYPDVQERIRKELDSVVGTDRLPEFEDEEGLPYLSAALKELMRWRPVSNLGTLASTVAQSSILTRPRLASPVH